jgi:hypothetical protein
MFRPEVWRDEDWWPSKEGRAMQEEEQNESGLAPGEDAGALDQLSGDKPAEADSGGTEGQDEANAAPSEGEE